VTIDVIDDCQVVIAEQKSSVQAAVDGWSFFPHPAARSASDATRATAIALTRMRAEYDNGSHTVAA
jgi:hypothetical protein